MKAFKTCENGHENTFINKYCNKCGIEFKASIKPEFSPISSEISMKKYVVPGIISKVFYINDDTVIYKSDSKYYLFRFSDYKNEILTEHPIFNYGTEIADNDSLSVIYLIKDDVITSISKRFFDNHQIHENVDNIATKYIDASVELIGNNIVTLNSVGYVYNDSDVLNLDGSESFKFDFSLQSIVFGNSVIIGLHGTNLQLVDKSSGVSEEYTHPLSIDKVILSSEDVIFLDQSGDVYTADKKRFSTSVFRLPKLNNIHSIIANKDLLLAISYDEISIVDLNTTDRIQVITGTFEQDKVWLLGDNILALEKTPTINSYSICVYKLKKNGMSNRVLNRHEFDDVFIKDILYVRESLSKLIINFKGSDDVKYLAMVEV
jgi:hypothetical protein